MLVDHCSVAESDLWLGQEFKCVRDGSLLQKCLMLTRVRLNTLAFNALPSVGPDLIDMHVRENVCLVPASIHVELIEVAHKRVIGSRLGRILWVQVHPLILQGLEL